MRALRRAMIMFAPGAMVSLPRPLRAQEMRQLGVLSQLPRPHPAGKPFWGTLVAELAALGWEEGRNLRIEHRFGGYDHARLVAGARELAAKKVDVIYAVDDRAVYAAWTATKTVPIVMSSGAAVELGYAQSLARPGGNVTGFSWQVNDAVGREWSLLRTLRPGLAQVGIPVTLGATPQTDMWVDAWRTVVRAQGGSVAVLPDVLKLDDLAPLFAAADARGVQAMTWPTRFVLLGAGIGRLNAWAIERRVLVSAAWARRQVLLSFGFHPDEGRVVFRHIDRVLRGASPADMPIEQPRRFALTLNLSIARAMGLSVPAEVLLQATEVVE